MDSEPGYDKFHVQVGHGYQWIDLLPPVDGQRNLLIDVTVTIPSADYLDGSWRLRFLVISDEGWSDEDCLWDSRQGSPGSTTSR